MAGEHEMLPPENGAIVRFYRIGHGDCFLVAFGRAAKKRPLYVLIDCGCKNGSDQMLYPVRSRKEIADHVMATTGGEVDVAILTHEHDDHLNGINEDSFGKLKIGELWLAWTESETDELAGILRAKKQQALATLANASLRLSAFDASDGGQRSAFIDDLFEMEAGETVEQFRGGKLAGAAGGKKKEGVNRRALRVFRESAKSIKYLYPHAKPHAWVEIRWLLACAFTDVRRAGCRLASSGTDPACRDGRRTRIAGVAGRGVVNGDGRWNHRDRCRRRQGCTKRRRAACR